MYGNSYDYSPDNGGSQPGRGKVSGNGNRNENDFSGTVYGHGMPQHPGQPLYSQQEISRRPLQTMQLENQQMAPRQQQQVYYGHSQPQMYSSHPPERQPSSDFNRPYGYGRGFSQPMDFPPSMPQRAHRQPGHSQQGLGDVDMRFAGQPPQPFQAHPEDRPWLGGPMYPNADVPVAGAGYAGANMMYCEPPPPMYSGFKPTCTSTPVTNCSVAPVTDTMSTGRGYQYQPSSDTPSQQPQRHASSVAATVEPIWAHPSQKKTKLETTTSRSGASGSRVAPIADKASPLNKSAARSPAPSTSSPASESSSRPAQSRQHGRAAPNIERGIRVLTGTVDSILVWGRKLDEEVRPNIIFEIVGSLDSVVRGEWRGSQLLCLRGLDSAKNATISAVFWEIDRRLAPPPLGSTVVCVCRVGPNRSVNKYPVEMTTVPKRRLPRMQVLKMKAISAGQVVHYKRLVFISSHAVTQGALSASTATFTTTGSTEQEVANPSPAPLMQTLISSYSTRTPRL